MAEIQLSEGGYAAINILAQERGITPAQFVEALATRLMDYEAEQETQAWLNDPEAMTIVRELRTSRAQGKSIAGTPIEAIMRQMGIPE